MLQKRDRYRASVEKEQHKRFGFGFSILSLFTVSIVGTVFAIETSFGIVNSFHIDIGNIISCSAVYARSTNRLSFKKVKLGSFKKVKQGMEQKMRQRRTGTRKQDDPAQIEADRWKQGLLKRRKAAAKKLEDLETEEKNTRKEIDYEMSQIQARMSSTNIDVSMGWDHLYQQVVDDNNKAVEIHEKGTAELADLRKAI